MLFKKKKKLYNNHFLTISIHFDSCTNILIFYILGEKFNGFLLCFTIVLSFILFHT